MAPPSNVLFRFFSCLVAGIVLQLFVFQNVNAQDKEEDKEEQRVVMFSAYGGYSIPQGSLKADYGDYWEAGGGILYQNKARFIIGLDYSYFFGTEVKKDPVPNLRTPDGNIISKDGSYAFFKAFNRGFMFPLIRLGKTFSLTKKTSSNKLGGLTVMAGGAWLQHWTFVQDISKNTPQFSGAYIDGYDRLRSGPGFGGWLGYLYVPEKGSLNFHIEAGYFQAFTKTRRYDFVTQQPAGQAYTDGMLQMRLRICFTVRSRAENTFYYY